MHNLFKVNFYTKKYFCQQERCFISAFIFPECASQKRRRGYLLMERQSGIGILDYYSFIQLLYGNKNCFCCLWCFSV